MILGLDTKISYRVEITSDKINVDVCIHQSQTIKYYIFLSDIER